MIPSFGRQFVALCMLLLAFGTSGCAPPTATQPTLERSRPKLSLTGLFRDINAGTLAEGVRFYQPKFAPWANGASVKRWILLPEGSQIDTSDPTLWRFPNGTKLWQEYSLGGKKLETRMMERVGGGPWDWVMISYVWNKDGTDAQRALIGESNLQGTGRDALHAGFCTSCHGGRANRVLGFSALQLNHDKSGVTLKTLLQEKRLSAPIEDVKAIPGDATQQNALGYLHANCSGCHNSGNKMQRERLNPMQAYSFGFLLTVGMSTLAATDTYKTAIASVGAGQEPLVSKSTPEQGRILRTLEGKSSCALPSVGAKGVDKEGVALLKKWMETLP